MILATHPGMYNHSLWGFGPNLRRPGHFLLIEEDVIRCTKHSLHECSATLIEGCTHGLGGYIELFQLVVLCACCLNAAAVG